MVAKAGVISCGIEVHEISAIDIVDFRCRGRAGNRAHAETGDRGCGTVCHFHVGGNKVRTFFEIKIGKFQKKPGGIAGLLRKF